MATEPVPRYFGLRIYLIAVMLYLLLVFPISVIMLFKYGPYWMEERGLRADGSLTEIIADAIDPDTTDTIAFAPAVRPNQNDKGFVSFDNEDIRYGQSMSLLLKMLLISFVLGFIWHYPFKRMMNRKRRGKKINNDLLSFCRRWLFYTPVISSLILGLSFFVTLAYMALDLIRDDLGSDISQQFFLQFFYISLVASILSVFFVYFWQVHRVRFKYLHHVFDSLSLYKASTKKTGTNIKYRLWINSGMTTLLPLSIVVFYLFLSISQVKKIFAEPLNEAQVEVLLGKYLSFMQATNMHDGLQSFFYVNAIDSLLMFVGIFTGIIISVIYLFFFVHWTTQGIVVPMNEVLGKMKESGEGRLGKLAIVRAPDEFGRLATGFNEMAVRISKNIDELKEITQANQRFVPAEFLQMMGKKSITEVNLGDQVQKQMTVLFIDIHSFTSLSETMDPRENFNFLNNYLGFMEPEIHSNNGFIDKFIGDSIMALFSQKPDDALDAAISLRIKLNEFNLMLQQTGRQPIQTGTGIHHGNLMLGVVGGEARMETTVISDAVNLASRLEGLTREYGSPIIVSGNTLDKLENKEKYLYRYLDKVVVKGRKEAVQVYEVFGPGNGAPSRLYLQLYEEALKLFESGKYRKAKEIFIRLALESPSDKVISLYRQRCEKLLTETERKS